DLEEEEITELKEQAKALIEAQGDRAGGPQERATSKAAIEQAGAKAKAEAKKRAKVAAKS
ncbi:MAG TPA: hypothetical protein VM913_03255, partial [Sphingomicrobium sp.]|nr:hypothetical protein [Sphingomicrobium sp.]